MMITFKNSDERKNHPLVGLIPDDVWHRYFIANKIEEKLLNIMAAKPDGLLKQIQDSSRAIDAYCEKEQILAAIIFCHQNLSLDKFNEIFQSIYGESTTISDDILSILAASSNSEYLKHALLQVTNINFLSTAFFSAAKNGHLNVLRYLEAKAPNDLQAMITAYAYAAFRGAAVYGHLDVLRYLEAKAPNALQAMITACALRSISRCSSKWPFRCFKVLSRYSA